MLQIVLAFWLSCLVVAQHNEQPAKESSTDLRTNSVLFSIEDTLARQTYFLERTVSMDYVLRTRREGEDVMRKISSKDALGLDQDFAGKFLKCQYELPTVEGECQISWKLSMKGEEQEICSKDDKKSQEMASFLQQLKQFL
jgi:hypothetical protein